MSLEESIDLRSGGFNSNQSGNSIQYAQLDTQDAGKSSDLYPLNALHAVNY